MAFDLNKGEEKKKFDLSKSGNESNSPAPKAEPAKKFDLSKSEEMPQSRIEMPAKNSSDNEKKPLARWLAMILAVVALGAGIWFFINHQDSNAKLKEPISQNTAPTNPRSSQSVENNKTDTTNAAKAVATTTSVNPTNEAKQPTTKGEEGPGKVTDKNQATSSNNPTKVATSKANVSSANNKTTPTDNSSKKVDKVTSNSTSSNGSQPSKPTFNNKVSANFGYRHSDLISKNDQLIAEIVSFLATNPTNKITINGYSSSEGDLSYNTWLSKKRATTFRDFLILKGVSSNQIKTVGKGIENPIASNDTEEGRSQNRRVEVILQ